MLAKFSVQNVLGAWRDNKPLIDAYLKNHSIEGNDDNTTKKVGTIMGVGIGIFIIVALLVVVLWFWALYALIKFWALIPTWAKVIGVIGLFFGWTYGIGTIITLVVVYATKRKNVLMSFYKNY